MNKKSIVTYFVAMLVLLLIITGCTADNNEGQPGALPTGTAEAQQLSDQAQEYITMSRIALAEDNNVDTGAIALDSITEPAAEGEAYIIILSFNGQTFEYHGRNGEVMLVSEPLPTAPEMTEEAYPAAPTEANISYSPAEVEEVEVTVDTETAEPVQLIVHGNLRSGCEEIYDHSIEMVDDTTFAVELTASKPEGVPCTMILKAYEETFPLTGILDLPTGEYTIIVNDEITTTFQWENTSVTGAALPAVDFKLDETVYQNAVSETVAAVDGTNAEPFWEILPEYTTITLEGYAQSDSIYEPQVFLYPVEALTAVNDTAAIEINKLQTILETQPDLTMSDTLPFLPLSGDQQATFARADYLTFTNGSGIRYLTQYAHAESPINNQELVYTFQGLTDDGQYYIAAVLPISHPDLPATADEAPIEEANSYDTYLAGVIEQLNAASADAFTPNLDTLDSIINSLSVKDIEEHDESAVPEMNARTEADLVAALEDAGAQVRLSTEPIVAEDVLSIPGNIIYVNGEDLQVYVYDNAEDATTDAARISPDGSEIAPAEVGDATPSIVDWNGSPHFYQWDNILILYVGDNADMLNLLTETIGETFAG